MDERGWTAAQALELLRTPAPIMRWLGVVRQIRNQFAGDAAAEGGEA